jgi:hypothetical protein
MAKAALIICEFAAPISAVFRGFPARAIKEFVCKMGLADLSLHALRNPTKLFGESYARIRGRRIEARAAILQRNS